MMAYTAPFSASFERDETISGKATPKVSQVVDRVGRSGQGFSLVGKLPGANPLVGVAPDIDVQVSVTARKRDGRSSFQAASWATRFPTQRSSSATRQGVRSCSTPSRRQAIKKAARCSTCPATGHFRDWWVSARSDLSTSEAQALANSCRRPGRGGAVHVLEPERMNSRQRRPPPRPSISHCERFSSATCSGRNTAAPTAAGQLRARRHRTLADARPFAHRLPFPTASDRRRRPRG